MDAVKGGAVIVLENANDTIFRSFRNIPKVDVVRAVLSALAQHE